MKKIQETENVTQPNNQKPPTHQEWRIKSKELQKSHRNTESGYEPEGGLALRQTGWLPTNCNVILYLYVYL